MADVTKSIGATGRDYSTIAAWEADLDNGAIYSSGDVAIGECYDDAAFLVSTTTTINGGGTVGLAHRILRAASGEVHDGTAGTGARIVTTAAITSSVLVCDVAASPITVEGLEVDGADLGHRTSLISSSTASESGVSLQRLIVHHQLLTNNSTAISGVGAGSNHPFAVLNSLIYNIVYDRNVARSATGILLVSSPASGRTQRVHNTTIFRVLANQSTSTKAGVSFGDVADSLIQNVIVGGVGGTATGAAVNYSVASPTTATVTYNISEDGTASGTGSITTVDPADLFVSTTGGSEDLHLKSGADAIDAGTDLGTTPTGVNIDIDGRDRDAEGDTWDIGAHEFVSTGGPEEGVGAATGTATATAIGRAEARSDATATGSATVAAVGRSEARAVGTATAGASVVGVGRAEHRGTGAATGSAAVVSVGRAAYRGLALAAGVASVLAIGAAEARATGAATATASVAAVSRVEARAVGAATGSASVVGLSATPSAAGSATGAATVVGVGRAEHRAAGGAAGSATAAAVGRAEARTVGSASGSATVDGVSSLAGSSGTATGTAAVVGVGRAEHRGVGASSGTATVDGIGRTAGTAPGDGAATGSASVVGVGRAEHRAVGAATGSATAAAAGVAAQFAAGAATGSATVVGVGRAESCATGAASGSAAATAAARREIRAVGTATGTATVVGWSQEFILWAETPPCRPTLVSLQPTHDLVSLQPTHSLLGYCDGAWTMTLHLTRGWTAPIPLRLETSDGPVATTGLALTLYARRPDGTYLDTTGDLEADPDQAANPGKIWWTPDAGDLDIGPVELRVEAIDQTGAAAYFPQGQPLRVSVWRV